jgi:hypothetical protein
VWSQVWERLGTTVLDNAADSSVTLKLESKPQMKTANFSYCVSHVCTFIHSRTKKALTKRLEKKRQSLFSNKIITGSRAQNIQYNGYSYKGYTRLDYNILVVTVVSNSCIAIHSISFICILIHYGLFNDAVSSTGYGYTMTGRSGVQS